MPIGCSGRAGTKKAARQASPARTEMPREQIQFVRENDECILEGCQRLAVTSQAADS
jgi:hypothetical protein